MLFKDVYKWDDDDDDDDDDEQEVDMIALI